jgi:hypothetical protein
MKQRWTYNKRGERVTVSFPITAQGKQVKKPAKTMTGKIGASVGYPKFGSK